MRLEGLRAGARGATLLEVAVTLLVLALGLLGLIRMQGLARLQLFEAAQRTTASGLARDVLTRLHENRDALAAYQALGPIAFDSGQELTRDCRVQNCSSSERVSFDAHQWRLRLGGIAPLAQPGDGPRIDGGLVMGQLCIVQDEGQVAVEVSWHSESGDVEPAMAGESPLACSGEDDSGQQVVRMVSHVGDL